MTGRGVSRGSGLRPTPPSSRQRRYRGSRTAAEAEAVSECLDGVREAHRALQAAQRAKATAKADLTAQIRESWEAGVGYAAMAEAMGVSRQYVAELANGRQPDREGRAVDRSQANDQ